MDEDLRKAERSGDQVRLAIHEHRAGRGLLGWLGRRLPIPERWVDEGDLALIRLPRKRLSSGILACKPGGIHKFPGWQPWMEGIEHEAVSTNDLVIDEDRILRVERENLLLQRDIAERGMVRPIRVLGTKPPYDVVDGIMRLRACRNLGLPVVAIARNNGIGIVKFRDVTSEDIAYRWWYGILSRREAITWGTTREFKLFTEIELRIYAGLDPYEEKSLSPLITVGGRCHDCSSDDGTARTRDCGHKLCWGCKECKLCLKKKD